MSTDAPRLGNLLLRSTQTGLNLSFLFDIYIKHGFYHDFGLFVYSFTLNTHGKWLKVERFQHVKSWTPFNSLQGLQIQSSSNKRWRQFVEILTHIASISRHALLQLSVTVGNFRPISKQGSSGFLIGWKLPKKFPWIKVICCSLNNRDWIQGHKPKRVSWLGLGLELVYKVSENTKKETVRHKVRVYLLS